MNRPILNREFQHPADGWYQIEALGEHPNREAGVVQVIDDQASAAIVAAFNRDATAGALRHGNEMLIDHEHFSDQPDKESRAYGWLQQLQNRSDGIYGQIRWTRTGKEAVDGGDYRFFSTEYEPADLVPVKNRGASGGKMVRPMRLGGLSLTNMNNNRGQKPITNRGPEPHAKDAKDAKVRDRLEEFRRGVGTPAAGSGTNTPVRENASHGVNQIKNKMKTVLVELELSADAAEDSALTAVRTLKNRAVKAEGEIAPLKNRVTELETSIKTLLDEQVDGILAEHGVTDAKVINRLKPLIAPLKNRAERVECLADLGIKAPAAGKKIEGKVLNRADAKTPAARATDSTTTGDDSAKAEKIRNRANALKGAAPGRDFHSCWQEAERDIANATAN